MEDFAFERFARLTLPQLGLVAGLDRGWDPRGTGLAMAAVLHIVGWLLAITGDRRDHGSYEDTAIKKIPSLYREDRSAATPDLHRVARSGFAGRYAILIYGFEDPHRPLDWRQSCALAGETWWVQRGSNQ